MPNSEKHTPGPLLHCCEHSYCTVWHRNQSGYCSGHELFLRQHGAHVYPFDIPDACRDVPPLRHEAI